MWGLTTREPGCELCAGRALSTSLPGALAVTTNAQALLFVSTWVSKIWELYIVRVQLVRWDTLAWVVHYQDGLGVWCLCGHSSQVQGHLPGPHSRSDMPAPQRREYCLPRLCGPLLALRAGAWARELRWPFVC